MPTRLTTPALTEPELFDALHPDLARWFRRRFETFSPAQLITVPEILAGRTTLLSSPTGSGKTLAAFLGILDHLAKLHDADALPRGIVALYVSPLRALTYDLGKNLQQPLTELGWDFVRVATRTGDTTPAERAAQRRKPPHILLTTPESLTLLLSQPAWATALRTTRFLVIDELHALAENKRGALLMLAAERLESALLPAAERRSRFVSDHPSDARPPDLRPSDLRPSPLTRIGLSATVAPLELMAAYLAGPDRPCGIASVEQPKPIEISVFSPLRENPYPPAGYTATRVLRELAATLHTRRTTLIFTNTRSGAETIGLRLKQIAPDLADFIEVHHASIDRAIRLETEDRLKRGELRAVVCSTSLEMGIDIGSIDLVVMVSAPKGVARALQRIGRSGHSMGETSRGLLVATNINDLAECAVTVRMMRRRQLEPLKPHVNPLDVLAQHLVGIAVFADTTPDDAFALVRRSQPFHTLPRGDFDRIVRYLEGGGVSLERNYRDLFGKLRIDADGHLALPSPRIAREFFQNVGTIHSDAMVQVKLGRRTLGQVEETFMKGLSPGDVFVLNGRSLRLLSTQLLTAKVADAKSALPTVPRWNANKMPLASGLASEVVRLRTAVAARLASDPADHARAIAYLQSEYSLSADNAAAITRHFALQATLSIIPTAASILVESHVEGDLRHYVVHALIGRSANDALSRIVARRIQQTRGGNALVTIDDYGFLLTLRDFQAIDTAEAWRALFAREGAEADLAVALATSNLVKWHFRGVAQTGLMVPRRVRGTERGARSLQWSSEIIFDVLDRHEPDHPLLAEARAEATLRFLDTPRAITFLDSAATLPWDLRRLDRISPFAFGIFVSRIKETMTLEDPETTIERLYHEMYGVGVGEGARSEE